MPLDKNAYQDLDRRFKDQVEKDKDHAVERVQQGWGVYLPCREPEDQVDYIFVGMEPSFRWADNVQEGERKVEEGARDFGLAQQPKGTIGALHALDRTISLPIRRDLPPNGCVERSDARDGGSHGP